MTWWPKNSQNPEIEHKRAQFQGSEMAGARREEAEPRNEVVGTTRTPKLSTFVLNFGVARWWEQE